MNIKLLKKYAYEVRISNTTKFENKNDFQSYLFERKTVKIIEKLDKNTVFDMESIVNNIIENDNLKSVYEMTYVMVKNRYIEPKELKYLLPIDTFIDGLIEKYPGAKNAYPDRKLTCEVSPSIDQYTKEALDNSEKYEQLNYELFLTEHNITTNDSTSSEN